LFQKEKKKKKKEMKKPVVVDVGVMREIIRKQNADGSFPIESLKLVIPSVSLDVIRKLVPASVSVDAKVEAIIITAIVCAYLEKNYSSQSTSWNLVVKKSKTWIKKESERMNISQDWSQLAFSFLG